MGQGILEFWKKNQWNLEKSSESQGCASILFSEKFEHSNEKKIELQCWSRSQMRDFKFSQWKSQQPILKNENFYDLLL